jgi:hypothetical protein
MRLTFVNTTVAVEVPDDPQMLSALRAAAPGWPFAESTSEDEPVATIRGQDGIYEIDIPGQDPIAATAVNAACSAMVDFASAYIDDNPVRFCFHCGAALFAGRLVMFPSRSHAGKSTLIGRLAASGHVIFCDDILPVFEDGRAIALGIAPRLRLPLPQAARPRFRQFVSRHTGASDGHYLYLNLPDGNLAPHNSTAPLGALVLLDRRPEGPAVLGQASRSSILQSLIMRNFAREASAADLLHQLHDVMDTLPRLVLRYSCLEEAAALLEETFNTWPPRIGTLKQAALLDMDPIGPEVASEEDGVPPRPDLSYPLETSLAQNPTVSLRAVDGNLFLADAEGLSIYQLNTMGAGLWNLLAKPINQHDAAEVLCGAFPDVDRTDITQDVARLFSALARAPFILPSASAHSPERPPRIFARHLE